FGVASGQKLPRRVAGPSSDELFRLKSLIWSQAAEAADSSRAPLLLIDDVQHLAARREFQTFEASLRTILDTSPARILVLFAGANPEAIRRIFWNRKAPFFASAFEAELPNLGDAYLKHLERTFLET